ncbi:MAG: type I-C CRISPR-associated protein Cas8c/Csd1 [Mediterranea sp.]|jgi:CRISPR-associated protein Csd1|nr:type I-C CRISPR-associated protein Cas8c/Csd1 [Mediterranea sp.]
MILKALYDYYQRCGDLAPEGFEDKEIQFILRIDKNGKFLNIEDNRPANKKEKGKTFQVVRSVGRTGTKFESNILWDNEEYVLNYLPGENEDAALKSQKKHGLFVDKVKELSKLYPYNEKFLAVQRFYELDQKDAIKSDTYWAEIVKKPAVNLSFRLNDDRTIVAEEDDIGTYIRAAKGVDTLEYVCLVTGKKGKPILTHPKIKMGTKTQTVLVAFQKDSGYNSFGHSQGMNAPISESAVLAYTTALNHLLESGSKNKFYAGNRTFLFWASSHTEATQKTETGIFNMFSNNENDDPNRRIDQVKKVFSAIDSGTLKTTLEDKFYILGLAPNAARIAVVYWEECPLRDFAKRILKHFEDMEIVDRRKDKKPYFGLHSILSAVALPGKESKVQPNLPEAIIKSILQATPYPYTLFMACINRIRTEVGEKKKEAVTITRAAIIKAYLNRLNNNYKKIETMIDKENPNQGYLCGRLFATLEYLQERSNGIHSIRERYMNAASATPAAVFSTLLNLSVHHAEKLEKGGQIYFEQLKTEIISKISSEGFPAHLDLQDQGRFMVGYYHQRQEFYTSKSGKQDNVTSNNQEQ